MFGNIGSQIIGYYLIAVVCIGLGYGHLALRRWARIQSLALLWFWLVEGLPLTFIFLFVLFSSKELSLVMALIATGLLGLCYLVVPGSLIRFYQGRNVRLTFETKDPVRSVVGVLDSDTCTVQSFRSSIQDGLSANGDGDLAGIAGSGSSSGRVYRSAAGDHLGYSCRKRSGDRHFQRFHGENLLNNCQNARSCRIDVLSAGHLDLLPYLSERILIVLSRRCFTAA
jgi:hypothetical protein